MYHAGHQDYLPLLCGQLEKRHSASRGQIAQMPALCRGVPAAEQGSRRVRNNRTRVAAPQQDRKTNLAPSRRPTITAQGVSHITCPGCSAAMTSSAPLPVGKVIKCPRCARAFPVTPAAPGPRSPLPPRPTVLSPQRARTALAGGTAQQRAEPAWRRRLPEPGWPRRPAKQALPRRGRPPGPGRQLPASKSLTTAAQRARRP